MGPEVVFETGLNGVLMYGSEKFGQLEVKWRPIDSYVTNARKYLEVCKNGSLYKERT